MQDKIKNLINDALKNLGIEENNFVVEHPEDLKNGDYSTNVAMVCAKKLKMNPKDLAQKITNELSLERAVLSKVEAVGGFINFYLSQEFFVSSIEKIIKNPKFGENTNLAGKKFFIEHTQPNPFKEFHIGHLMNNAIGEAMVRIVKDSGAEVKVASYHGDKGLHVAKAIWGFLKEKNWQMSYALGAKAYEEGAEAKKEIEDLNKKIYGENDEEINKIYAEGRKISFDYFESIYRKLDSHFDFHFYESEAGDIGKKLVLDNMGKVFEDSEGAVVFKGENFEPKTHTRVFLNSEKLPTYEAKEVGLAQIKKDKYKYDESLTITANEQDAFFKVVEVAIGEVFPELKGKLKHISHGMLRLPSGKMSSRTGDVITAESLIETVKEKTKGDESVAIAAIKYMILRQAIGGDIIFDIEKSVSTEGDSGPYLQYATVRANSVLEKGKEENLLPSTKVDDSWATIEIEKLLYKFPEVVLYSAQKYEPHHIVNYLTDLARSYNSFYGNNKIIDKSDASSPYKLALTSAFATVMRNGLYLLGIKVPEKM
ncbi:MAG: arginine--tRNA ligase [Candidatus Paceibacterota bacterium]|jgi:arginyl-tRNA synthetase